MNINRMLIGLDFGAASIAAARWAKSWFAPNAELILAHVVEPPDRPRFARDSLPPEELLESSGREYATARMHEISSYLSAEPVQTEIRVGKPYEQLAMLAGEVNADLVVIGPHGWRPHTSKFLGVTAERVVRCSPVPVLVATKPQAGIPRHILVPVDDVEITGSVVETARQLAIRFQAEVTLLHVWSNAVYSHVASMSYAQAHSDAEAKREIDEELVSTARHWLTHVVKGGIDDKRITVAVTYGKPGDATIAMANQTHADLIVLGRNSTGVVAPAFLGSTIGTVLHDARCPVLVVTNRGD
jgi:nucleotide-binding universal stress UspA family protein